MPRKGFEKVRTGCVTCKIRKIKCDESRPHCLKCTSTGRRCDGYKAAPAGAYSWNQLLRVQPTSMPETDTLELRSLTFFRQVVAPSLSGPLDTSFWTRLVAQVVHQEPAAKHAVVAISTLYEHFGSDSAPSQSQNRQDFALQHYNNAIKHVLALNIRNVDTILLVSVLFICIEFLRGNAEGAISHLEHGVSVLLGSNRSNSALSAVYQHLAIFPFFFSDGIFPAIPLLHHQLNDQFQTLPEAQVTMDWLSSRIIRLVRAGDHYRLGTTPAPVSQPLVIKQQQLVSDLNRYYSAATKLWGSSQNADISSLLLEMRWHVCKIWVSTCFAQEETVYDEHVSTFEKIVSLAERARASQGLDLVKPSKFSFQMGFSPLLHFVVIKCRHLRLRLAALLLQEQLSCSREILWDAAIMGAVGRRIIEIEHSQELNSGTIEVRIRALGNQLMPADGQRIRDSVLEEETRIVKDEYGRETVERKIRFFVSVPEGGIGIMYDWIELQ